MELLINIQHVMNIVFMMIIIKYLQVMDMNGGGENLQYSWLQEKLTYFFVYVNINSVGINAFVYLNNV